MKPLWTIITGNDAILHHLRIGNLTVGRYTLTYKHLRRAEPSKLTVTAGAVLALFVFYLLTVFLFSL